MHTLVPIDASLLEQMVTTGARSRTGLTPRAFAQFTTALSRTPWGQAHLRGVALIDGDGRVLASALLYRMDAVLEEEPVTVCAAGDVIAHDDHAAAEHRAALIAGLVNQVDRFHPGVSSLLTRSDGPRAVPESIAALPAIDSTLRVLESTRRGAPMAPVRSGHRDDIGVIAAMPRLGASHPRFRLERSAAFIDFALTRQRLLAGLSPNGQREMWFLVVEEGMRAAAYAVITVIGDQWVIEECGDNDPSGARVGAILQTLIAREPSARRPRITAWLPHGFVPPQVIVESTQASAQCLGLWPIRTVAGLHDLRAADVAFWHGDLM